MSPNTFDPQTILNFYTAAEKLKSVMRHSWLSNGERQESVAEHTWMMGLLAMILLPHVDKKLDQQKVLRMIIIHDLAEAVTADMPVWEGQENKVAKQEAEEQAIVEMLAKLDDSTAQDLYAVWKEYEDRVSDEAHFVKLIDTFDVVAQHNTAPIESFDDNDYLWHLSPLQDAFFDSDPNMRKLKDALDEWSIKKVGNAGNLDKLDQAELKKRLRD